MRAHFILLAVCDCPICEYWTAVDVATDEGRECPECEVGSLVLADSEIAHGLTLPR